MPVATGSNSGAALDPAAVDAAVALRGALSAVGGALSGSGPAPHAAVRLPATKTANTRARIMLAAIARHRVRWRATDPDGTACEQRWDGGAPQRRAALIA